MKRTKMDFNAENWYIAQMILENYQKNYKITGYAYNSETGKGYVEIVK